MNIIISKLRRCAEVYNQLNRSEESQRAFRYIEDLESCCSEEDEDDIINFIIGSAIYFTETIGDRVI